MNQSENNQEEEVKIMNKHDLYFNAPLYETISTSELEEEAFYGDVDAYSAKNSSDTTYAIKVKEIDCWDVWNSEASEHVRTGFFLVTLKCKRKDNDILRFVFFRSKELVLKVGQWPSLADLQFAELGKKYDKVLPKEDLKNLKKAIGLVAHGAGAGSFVYLRRIFENLIFETYQQHTSTVSEKEFKSKRMEDKVEVLKAFLPSQLLEMKSIYGILSKGVHELSEEECLRYFAPLKLSIELILDQKIEQEKKRERDAAVKKQLQDISQELGAVKGSDSECESK